MTLIKRGSQIPEPKAPRCRRCFKAIREDGHGAYCSSDCLQSESEEVAQDRIRALVFKRDKGICCECGEDCVQLREEMNRAAASPLYIGIYRARLHQLHILGFDRHAVENGHALWEMDHTTPRAAGGKNTLASVRTLCIPCHKKATKSFATKRAIRSKPKGRRA